MPGSIHSMSVGKLERFLETLDAAGVAEDDVDNLLAGNRVGRKLTNWWVDQLKKRRADEPIAALKINYSQSLAKMIAAGEFDRVSPGITEESFPIAPGPERVEATRLQFETSCTTGYVLTEMERRLLRPATLPELLAFARSGHQSVLPTIALGAAHRPNPVSYSFVCSLMFDETGSHLLLEADKNDWDPGVLFLAIRKYS
ncbi:MAG TPA: hypothetical protein VLE72_03045 [Candidatus Saccharimonadales bacterium]|nr:hypothetical protein [Candidatus Saccharimonadales bacterium]